MLGRAVYTAFTAAGHNVKGTAFTRAEGDLVKVSSAPSPLCSRPLTSSYTQIDLQDKRALDELLKEFRPESACSSPAMRSFS